jgi:hypothetical protein
MSSAMARDRLDRILANKAGLNLADDHKLGISCDAIRRKLITLVQEKRFLIYALLRTAPVHGLTQKEIAAAIGTGGDRFEFHLSALCRERILLVTRDDARVARFRINPVFASAAARFLADSLYYQPAIGLPRPSESGLEDTASANVRILPG